LYIYAFLNQEHILDFKKPQIRISLYLHRYVEFTSNDTNINNASKDEKLQCNKAIFVNRCLVNFLCALDF
jgi:hypothetical protein